MGLIENQQRTLASAQPIAQRAGVILVAHQRLAEDETGVGRPGVDAPAAFAPHAAHVGPVHHRKAHAEAALHFPLPLQHHRRRRHHHHPLHLLAQQQLPHDQPGLDRLAQAHVIGDEQAHPRHPQRLAQRFQLVGLYIDAGPQWRLEQARIGAGDAVPLQGVQITGEHPAVIKAPLAHRVPAALAQHPGIHLPLPEHLQHPAIDAIIQAGHAHNRVTACLLRRPDLFDEVIVAAAINNAAGRRQRSCGAV